MHINLHDLYMTFVAEHKRMTTFLFVTLQKVLYLFVSLQSCSHVV
jgi:hypothetical protein